MCISHLTSTESPGIICSLPSSLALLLLEVNVRKREGRQFAAARPAGERAGAGARLGCAVFRRVNLAPPARVQALLLETQDEVAQAGQVVREAVGGLPTVRSFGAEEHEACRYEEALERCRKLRWRGNLECALYLLFRRMLHLVMQVLMLSCGLQQILAGTLTRGGLLSFLLFQEDVGHYVQVSGQPRVLFVPVFLSSLWALGFIGSP